MVSCRPLFPHPFRLVVCGAATLALLGLVPPVQAHENGLLTPSDLWTHWNSDFPLVVSLPLTVWLYSKGVTVLWSRAGQGRGIRRWQVAAFTAGMLALAIALLSPLDALGGALVAGHMAQHLLLMAVAAPPLVLGAPQTGFLWALPRSWRQQFAPWQRQPALRRTWRALTLPLVAWSLHAGLMWLWHLPTLYQAALHDGFMHGLQHFCFFGSGLLYWWVIVHPHSRVGQGYNVLSLFAMAMQSSLLGALMTFSRIPWYPDYQTTAVPWGLTPLVDQQLAGLLMWLPAGLVYLAAVGYHLGNWLNTDEQRVGLSERKQEASTDVA